jgi:hypothetical protein
VFTSVKDLKRKLMRYIRRYNRAGKPLNWTYHKTPNTESPSMLNGQYQFKCYRPLGTLSDCRL